ncbi:MAG: hypothetical protein L3J49_13805 [Desulfobulbaceae bacterium]|nr:hypothetical protein [Desulfobulbaceae bacterium]
MSDKDQAKQEKKEAMKRLREQRKSSIQRAAAMVRTQKKDFQVLRKQMGAESATAPEIAEATGMDVALVIWYLATLKQYGEVVEEEKKGCYFSYRMVPRVTENTAA